jgi:hypothetical protein
MSYGSTFYYSGTIPDQASLYCWLSDTRLEDTSTVSIGS